MSVPIVRGARIVAVLLSLTCWGFSGLASAQNGEGVAIPHYWDTRQRSEPGAVRGPRVIRFLVDDEFPPFHYADADGKLAGFSVDLARAICAELRAACTIQARRWDTLLDSLAEGRGDAIIAAMRITPEIKQRFAVTQPWHRSPARFVSRLAGGAPNPSPAALKNRKVAVVAGSAHEAFLKAFFPDAHLLAEPAAAAALAKLRAGEADYAFGDGVTLSLWLNGESSGGCCVFRGGPYLESRYFSEGVGIIARKDASDLVRAFDQTLALLAGRGVYADLYLKHFPVSFY